MVTFKELRISDDKSKILVDIEVSDLENNPEVYISGIYLEYYKNYNETTAYSKKALIVYEYNDGDPTKTSYSEPILQSQLSYDDNGVNTFDGGLFYLIVRTTDGDESYVDIGAVLDWQKVYAIGMMLIANFNMECNDRCSIPTYFEQFVLVYHALSIALETCDLTQIGMLWRRFIDLAPGITAKFNCNCS